MRDPNRIPGVLAAVERCWDERSDTQLLPFLLDVTAVRSLTDPDPLAEIDDAELLAALRGLTPEEPSQPVTNSVRPSRRELIEAIAERWNVVPDWRLGQLLVNAARMQRPAVVPHRLFLLKDGVLLERLRPWPLA